MKIKQERKEWVLSEKELHEYWTSAGLTCWKNGEIWMFRGPSRKQARRVDFYLLDICSENNDAAWQISPVVFKEQKRTADDGSEAAG